MFTQATIDNLTVDELVRYSISDQRCSKRLAEIIDTETVSLDAKDREIDELEDHAQLAIHWLDESIKELKFFLHDWHLKEPNPSSISDPENLLSNLNKVKKLLSIIHLGDRGAATDNVDVVQVYKLKEIRKTLRCGMNVNKTESPEWALENALALVDELLADNPKEATNG